MNKLLAIAVVAFLGVTGSAHAAVIDFTLGSTDGSFSESKGGTLNPNINLAKLGSNLTKFGAVIIAPPSSFLGDYTQPTGPLFGNNYLAVLGGPLTGSATITLKPNEDVFGFTWGTIDAYNTLQLTDSRGDVFTITGSELLAEIAGSIAGTTQSNVKFFDPYGTIVSAQLTSSQNAFEAGNFEEKDKVSSVPLPASLPLFAFALVGLYFVAQRKMKNSV